MSLKPKTDIGTEIHTKTTQFIRVESGQGIAVINGEETRIRPGSAVFIPPGTSHNIINDGEQDLKLSTLYAPSIHPPDFIEVNKPM